MSSWGGLLILWGAGILVFVWLWSGLMKWGKKIDDEERRQIRLRNLMGRD